MHPDQRAVQVEVEIEVEYVRREKIRYTTDLSQGLATEGLPDEVGRFLRVMQFSMHRGKDLVRGETPRLVGWRIIRPCDPDQLLGDHEYERIPGSDQASKCKRCGRVSGK